MAKTLDLDYETFCDLSIKTVGTDAYVKHPSCEVLMVAWSVDEGPVRQWVAGEDGDEPPAEFVDHMLDPKVEKWAHNAPFEIQVSKHLMGLTPPITSWRDTMVLAHYYSYPGALEKLSVLLGMGEDKKKISRGKTLIRRFCQPRKPTKNKPWTRETRETSPEEWEEFKEYNRQDVVAQMEVRRLLPKPAWKSIWKFWHLDQIINAKGLPVNMRMVENAIRIYEEEVARLRARMKVLTGLDNPNSGAQLLPWAQKHGYVFDDLKKGHVARGIERAKEALKDPFAAEEELQNARLLADVLGIRARASQTSPKKYHAIKRAVGPDGFLRYTFQFLGAQRTGRFSGRTFQPQNLPRPAGEWEDKMATLATMVETLDLESFRVLAGEPIAALKSAIRPTVQAVDGMIFADCDLSAIENRGIGWITGDAKVLGVFERGDDPYIDFGAKMFHKTYEEAWHEVRVQKKPYLRKVAKPGVLGCGYQLGPGKTIENKQTGEIEATGLLGYAWGMGVPLTEEESALSVEVFRREFKTVVGFWGKIVKTVKAVIRTGRPARLRMLYFDIEGRALRIRLPSGRYLHYIDPDVRMMKTPWGKVQPTITYMGIDRRRQWSRLTTHGGKLLENVTQAICLDLLLHGMLLAHNRGLDLRIHVHDQLVAMVPEQTADEDLALLRECMTTPPAWARDFPMDAGGFLSPVFMKD